MIVESLSGKTALVTGGARRLGRATALALAAAGVNVVIHYNSSRAEAEKTAADIELLGTKAYLISADLADDIQASALAHRASELAGGLDFLINSASSFTPSSFSDFTWEDLTESLRTNAWAPLVICRDFAKICKSGCIVNFLDTRIVGYDWAHVAYHAGKSMLELFTRMTALELAPGIRVNAVAPGLVLAPDGKDSSYLESLQNNLPLKKHGNEKDVCDAVLFLLASDFVTGQIIFVDGGRHLREGQIG